MFHKGLCWVQFYSRYIPSPWGNHVAGMVSNIISMLLKLNCMYPLRLVMQWISWRLNVESRLHSWDKSMDGDVMLKLNDIKTELVIIALPYFLQHNKVPLSSVQVGDSGISTSKCARNIGIVFDHHMNMTTQVIRMCQAAETSDQSYKGGDTEACLCPYHSSSPWSTLATSQIQNKVQNPCENIPCSS